jgi:hypothetical protein
MNVGLIGAFLLGMVLGYLTHFLVRRDVNPGVKDLGGIVGIIVGGVALKVLAGPDETSWYLIGLGVGFFLYWAALMVGSEKVKSPLPKTASERGLTLFPFLN